MLTPSGHALHCMAICKMKLEYDCLCVYAGYVRHTSSRFIPPNLNNGTGDYTLGRPVPPPVSEEEEGKKRKFPFRR